MRAVKTILCEYTKGKLSLEETNAELEKTRSPIRIDPERNKITDPETQGLLDTGTGTMDRVTVRDWEIMNCDCGSMTAFCFYKGRAYVVDGTLLLH